MSARLLEYNDLHILSPHGKLGFLGIGDKQEADRKAANLAEVQVKYPFPPNGCADAALKISQIEQDIKTHQEVLATQGDSRVDRRWIESLTQVKNDFSRWIEAAKCDQQQQQASDQQFWTQVDDALSKEKADGANKGMVDNWIIYGVLGLLGIGALFIILRK